MGWKFNAQICNLKSKGFWFSRVPWIPAHLPFSKLSRVDVSHLFLDLSNGGNSTPFHQSPFGCFNPPGYEPATSWISNARKCFSALWFWYHIKYCHWLFRACDAASLLYSCCIKKDPGTAGTESSPTVNSRGFQTELSQPCSIKCVHVSKSWENPAPPNQLFNKC